MERSQKNKPGKNFDRRLSMAFIAVVLITFYAAGMAAADVKEEARATINKSIDALWTGEDFSPKLQKKQQALREMFDREVISRADLKEMIAAKVLALMNQKKTSRYIVKKMPERVEKLLAPHVTWQDLRELVWQAGSSMIEEGQQAVISVATLAPEGTPWLAVPKKLIPVIEELSDHKFTIKIYAGGVMGEDTDILRKMDVGQLDGCGATAQGILSASPETSIFLLPGLFQNYEEVDYIFEKFRPKIDAAFEKRGYILASLIDTGFFYIFSKNKISSLADIRKSKVLTWFGEVETTLFKEIGVSAMPVSVTEVVSALSTGMADTNLAPPAWMLGMQAYQYAKYFVKEPLLYSPAAVIVSTNTRKRLQKKFGLSDNFSFNVQEMLIFEFSSLEPEWKEQARNYEARCLEAFETRVGMKAVTLPPEDRKTIEQAGKNVMKSLADKTFPQDFLNEIVIALDQYRQGRQ